MNEEWYLIGGVLFHESEEELREKRKKEYDRPCTGSVDEWEFNGYGYRISFRPDERTPWAIFRTDFKNYYTICYPFVYEQMMNAHIEREGWRPNESIHVSPSGQTRLEL